MGGNKAVDISTIDKRKEGSGAGIGAAGVMASHSRSGTVGMAQLKEGIPGAGLAAGIVGIIIL